MWRAMTRLLQSPVSGCGLGLVLSGVRQWVDYNPEGRLLDPWEVNKGPLSLEEGIHARHIALSYLSNALKTHLSIRKQFASTRVLANGKTAEDTFKLSLNDLSTKVKQLTDNLAEQGAQAF